MGADSRGSGRGKIAVQARPQQLGKKAIYTESPGSARCPRWPWPDPRTPRKSAARLFCSIRANPRPSAVIRGKKSPPDFPGSPSGKQGLGAVEEDPAGGDELGAAFGAVAAVGVGESGRGDQQVAGARGDLAALEHELGFAGGEAVVEVDGPEQVAVQGLGL